MGVERLKVPFVLTTKTKYMVASIDSGRIDNIQ